MKPTAFRSLSAKLLSIFLPLVGISVVALFGILEYQSYRTQRAALAESLQKMVEVEGAAFVTPVWEYDTDLIKSLLVFMGQHPDLHNAYIYDSTDALLGKVEPMKGHAHQHDLRAERPLIYKTPASEEQVGRIVVTFHEDRILKDLWARLNTDALILLVLVATIVVGMLHTTQRVIGQPLRRLQEAIEGTTAEQRQRVEWQSNDELGQVVQAYNDMQEREAAAEAEVANYRDHLEQLVEERTRELDSNRALLAQKTDVLQAVLDSMVQGVAAFDKDLRLIAWNDKFLEIREYPSDLGEEGRPFGDFMKIDIDRNEFGEGDPESQFNEQIARAQEFAKHEFERQRPSGQYLEVRGGPLPGGGFVSTFADVTDRKRAEEAVRESEQRLLAMLNDSPVGVSIATASDGKIVFANDRMSRMFFMAKQAFVGTQGRTYYADPEELRAMIAEFETKGKVRDLEIRLKRPDESEFWGLMSLSNFDYAGQEARIGWVYDITPRKEAEEELARALNISQTTLQTMDQGIIMVDSSFKLVAYNDRYLDVFGIPRNVVEGEANFRRIAEYFGTEIYKDPARADEILEGAQRTDEFSYEIVMPDGRFFEIRHRPREGGGFVRTYSDITDRKAAEEQLEREKAILDTTLETMDQGISMVDQDLRIMASNAKFAELLQFPKEVIDEGVNLETMFRFNAERGEYGDGDVEEQINTRMELARKFEAHQFERTRPDGVVLEIRGNPLPNKGGFVSTYTDITERKMAELRLAQAHQLITESITYASRIQRSLLPLPSTLEERLVDHFAIWEPKDVVGGDIYWYRPCKNGFLIALADCTGHGVPGAFMTIIATSALDRALIEVPDGDPGAVLHHMNRLVKLALGQDTDEGHSDDGLELGICRVPARGNNMTFAGARFFLWQHAAGQLEMVAPGDKPGIGYRHIANDQAYTTVSVKMSPGAAYYMTSDGMIDQVGGAKRRAYGKKRIGATIEAAAGEPMAAQRDALLSAFAEYQGEEERRDDVTMVGFVPRG